MMIFYNRKLVGNFIKKENGNKNIKLQINNEEIDVSISYSTFYNFLNRDDAIKLELKSHPSLICTETFDSEEHCYLCLASYNVLNIEQQVLVRVAGNSTHSINMNIIGIDFKKIYDLQIHKSSYSIREVPLLYKKDYLLFEKLLKQNNLSRKDLILIKDLKEI